MCIGQMRENTGIKKRKEKKGHSWLIRTHCRGTGVQETIGHTQNWQTSIHTSPSPVAYNDKRYTGIKEFHCSNRLSLCGFLKLAMVTRSIPARETGHGKQRLNREFKPLRVSETGSGDYTDPC